MALRRLQLWQENNILARFLTYNRHFLLLVTLALLWDELQELKAALLRAITTFARMPLAVPQLWERLLQSAIVRPLTQAEINAGTGTARFDLAHQLQDIAVSAQPNHTNHTSDSRGRGFHLVLSCC